MKNQELDGWGWFILRILILIPFLFFGFFWCGAIEIKNRIKYRKEWPQ